MPKHCNKARVNYNWPERHASVAVGKIDVSMNHIIEDWGCSSSIIETYQS